MIFRIARSREGGEISHYDIYKVKERKGMTVLDVMIQVGGLSEFAAGNRAKIIRKTPDGTVEIRVRLDDLINDGEITENIGMQPGDVLVMYTDGIVDAMNGTYESYGFERFSESIMRHSQLSSRDMVREMVHDMRTYVGKDENFDDVTLVIVKID